MSRSHPRSNARPAIPQGNLRDRIAALQQRNVSSSHTHDQHSPPSLIPTSRIGAGAATQSLREKIASFEKKGAVPAPRGSFGIGAPPVDDGSSRRKGELYGNRVPGLSKPIAVPVDFPGTPNSRRRTVSSSVLLNSAPRLSRPTSPTFTDSRSDSLSDVEDSPLSSRSQKRFSMLGDLSPSLPTSVSHSERRTVSDIPPFRPLSYGVSLDPPLLEAEEEGPRQVLPELVPEKPDEEAIPTQDRVNSSLEDAQLLKPPETPTIVVSPDPSPIEDASPPHLPTPPVDVVEVISPPSQDPTQIPEVDMHSESPAPLSTFSSPQPDPEPAVVDSEVSSSDLPYLRSHLEVGVIDTPLEEPQQIPTSPEVGVQGVSISSPIPSEEPAAIDASTSTEVAVETPQLPPTSPPKSLPQTPQLDSPVAPIQVDKGDPLAVDETPAEHPSPSPVDSPSTRNSSPVAVTPPSEYHSPLEEIPQATLSPLSQPTSPSPPDDGSVSSEAVLTPQDASFTSAEVSPSPKPTVDKANTPNEAEYSVILDESFVALAAPFLAFDAEHSIIINEPPAIITPPPASPEAPTQAVQPHETPVSLRPLSLVSDRSDETSNADGERSLALDTSEAIIVSEPPQVVSPTISRGVLVPAPTPKSLVPPPIPEPLPSPAPIPPEVSPSATAMVRSKSSRRTFHAVVHDRVREAGGEPMPALLSAQPVTPSTAKAPRAPRVIHSEPLPDTISPGLGDLAALMADAALLEEQLSGVGSPIARSIPAPAMIQVKEPITPITPVTPTPTLSDRERRPPQDVPDTVGEGEHDQAIEDEDQLTFREPEVLHLALPPKRSASLSAKSIPTPTRTTHPPLPIPPTPTTPHRHEHHFPTTPYRLDHPLPPTINEDGPPPPPPKSPPSAKRPTNQKLSMPGAYPRGSYSSEDSSVMVSTPPSPGTTHDHESLRSDTSSVKSSNKSLKSPKGLSRAGSFAERFWNRAKKKKSVNGG